jgi:hypothetical protein
MKLLKGTKASQHGRLLAAGSRYHIQYHLFYLDYRIYLLPKLSVSKFKNGLFFYVQEILSIYIFEI